jgi:hypothetical protein
MTDEEANQMQSVIKAAFAERRAMSFEDSGSIVILLLGVRWSEANQATKEMVLGALVASGLRVQRTFRMVGKQAAVASGSQVWSVEWIDDANVGTYKSIQPHAKPVLLQDVLEILASLTEQELWFDVHYEDGTKSKTVFGLIAPPFDVKKETES